MTSIGDPIRSSPFDADRLQRPHIKDLPILSASTTPSGHSPSDPMDLSPGYRDAQTSNSPNSDRHATALGADKEHVNGISAPTGAAAAAQQPKVVQTAFIHKLYR